MNDDFFTRRPGRPGREDGVALVVVLLFSVVILMMIISTTATMSLGARTGGVNERAAYQSLLAAESGLNTFPARARAKAGTTPFPERFWETDPNRRAAVNAWLGSLNSYGAGQGRHATLEFRLNDKALGKGVITLASKAEADGGDPAKTVVQDYMLTLPLSTSVRAALTSLPPIDATGNAQISGEVNTVRVGATHAPLSLSIGVSAGNISVTNSDLIMPGDYVRIGSSDVFRVDDRTPGMLNVTRVLPQASPLPALSLSAGSPVSLLMNAVRQNVTAMTDPMNIPVSNAREFVVDEEVTIDGKKAKVLRVDAATASIQVDWQAGVPASLAEGMQVKRDFDAMQSAAGIAPSHSGNGPQSIGQNYWMADDGVKEYDCPTRSTCSGQNEDSLRPLDQNDRFFSQMVLGITDEQIDALPYTLPPAQINGGLYKIKPEHIDDLLEGKTTSGIVIVDGDVIQNFNARTEFSGILYFRGNQGGKFNGNVTVNGAIAVRGGPIEGVTNLTDDTTTNAQGSLELKFNAAEIRRYLRAAAKFDPQPVPGTWRQQ